MDRLELQIMSVVQEGCGEISGMQLYGLPLREELLLSLREAMVT